MIAAAILSLRRGRCEDRGARRLTDVCVGLASLRGGGDDSSVCSDAVRHDSRQFRDPVLPAGLQHRRQRGEFVGCLIQGLRRVCQLGNLVVCTALFTAVRVCASCPRVRQMQTNITSLPTTGTLYQLSQVFSTYGYQPQRGVPITAPGTILTGTKNRLLYVPPPYTNQPEGLVRCKLYF